MLLSFSPHSSSSSTISNAATLQQARPRSTRAAGPCKRACKSLQGRSSQGRRGQTRGSLQQRAEQQHGRLGLYSIHLATFRQPSFSICYPLGWANLLTPGTAWLADCCTAGRPQPAGVNAV